MDVITQRDVANIVLSFRVSNYIKILGGIRLVSKVLIQILRGPPNYSGTTVVSKEPTLDGTTSISLLKTLSSLSKDLSFGYG